MFNILKLKPAYYFAAFIVLHIVLLNINAAEWGDSYRILRASREIKSAYSYPDDEKRPPLYSLLLATWPEGVIASAWSIDPVLWGRVIMFFVSLTSFYVFYKLMMYIDIISSESIKNLALILFMLNPVYLYWSLRLMADSFFGLLALISVYLYYSKIKPTLGLRTLNKTTIVYTSLLGFLSALAILTRFEGYILFFSLGCAMYWGLLPLNINSFKFSVLINQLQHSLLRLVGYVLSSLVVLIPYLYKNNPFSSSYLSEPNSRVYDINTLVIFILSFLFVFGFYFGFYFLYKNKNEVLKFYKENPLILIFTLLEVLLVLAWPAAVPRLFTPVIPFLIIPLAYSINTFFESGFLILYKIPIFNKKLKVFDISFMLSLMLIYVLGQYIYKLQFLIVLRFVFVALVLLHIVMLYTIYKKLSNVFYLLLVSILLLWSIATIWIHKDIHSVIKDASLYLVKQNAVVLHNDISSVTPWYLENRAIYSHTLRRLDVDQTELKLNNITHVLVTNEHNVNLGLKLDTFDFLTKEAEFSREVNGAVFKTVVYKVEQERL